MVFVTSLALVQLLPWYKNWKPEFSPKCLTSTIDLDELIHLMQVWEGEGVIKYGRKLIGATDPQKSEPGTIRGDLAVVVGR